MSKIIISYRRSFYDAIAGRVRDKLVSHYGDEAVYMDVDNIPYGTDFREHINNALNEGDVVIAIIGPKWVGPMKGRKARIFDETDPVRVEIETALNRGIAVVPILVDGARMPKPEELPEAISKFAFHNAAIVDAGRDFHQHMERLIRSMDMVLKETERRPSRSGNKLRLGLLVTAVSIAALAIGSLAFIPQFQKQYATYLGGQTRAVEQTGSAQVSVTARSDTLKPGSVVSTNVGRRVALVIGNAEYQNASHLRTPVGDALAIANLFRSSGFSVVLRSNIGNREFGNALRAFADEATKADIAVVFYSGHGAEVSNANYLIPVDAKLASAGDISSEAVSIEAIVSAIEGAKQLGVIFLDACRNDPFKYGFQSPNGTRSIARPIDISQPIVVEIGLTRVTPTKKNALIAYAAKAGSVAMDGDGEHSPFVEALLNNLASPGVDIRIVLGRVRDEVIAKTNGAQEPAVYGSMGGETISLAAPINNSQGR